MIPTPEALATAQDVVNKWVDEMRRLKAARTEWWEAHNLLVPMIAAALTEQAQTYDARIRTLEAAPEPEDCRVLEARRLHVGWGGRETLDG